MSVFRTVARCSRVRLPPAHTSIPRRFAHQSYGGGDSGYQESNSNPRRDLEHPGPDAPASKGQESSSSGSASSSGQPSSTELSHDGASSGKGSPAIQQPKSSSESDNPEVKKHNEEMRDRADKSVNQLSEDDNKVPPTYWKGDVGDPKKSNDS
ncbi:uncharacterized protein HMPREF1541_00889 [Cyphellophora europaea CBS 101466]|uniref:Uncharacterized protein n=1 Tax=Cyphellophora europaea (strain CBS 101466) TaxID=1220924 RepID=W2SDC0_CYPE1|nr:uncharacterized protein HMPREF1541_00889 [Cyphellophora europaea CBS 101466]ETN46702.1 hypothetical protein HMPREF1541_00889 [Cyphellophora europaea CBS 101466]